MYYILMLLFFVSFVRFGGSFYFYTRILYEALFVMLNSFFKCKEILTKNVDKAVKFTLHLFLL